MDPTAPDIHLGHTVVLRKLKHFQDLGHTAIFLIGDFSAMIGDPTGQSETRPPLTREQVDANAKTYLDQVYKILDRKRPKSATTANGSDKTVELRHVCVCAGTTAWRACSSARIFVRALQSNQPISVHELLYPLAHGLRLGRARSPTSRLGATEQKFNLLVGRDIQREYGQMPRLR